jgi:hypothetical protein
MSSLLLGSLALSLFSVVRIMRLSMSIFNTAYEVAYTKNFRACKFFCD